MEILESCLKVPILLSKVSTVQMHPYGDLVIYGGESHQIKSRISLPIPGTGHWCQRPCSIVPAAHHLPAHTSALYQGRETNNAAFTTAARVPSFSSCRTPSLPAYLFKYFDSWLVETMDTGPTYMI